MKIKIKYINVILILCFSLVFSAGSKKTNSKNNQYKISLNNSLHFGYDSNVMKFSESEDEPEHTSSYLGWKPSIKTSFKIFKRSTKLSLIGRIHNYFEVSEKSNYGFSINIEQPIGNYQYLKFSHIYIDDIYLRKYVDNDIYLYYQIDPSSDCYFDLTKNLLKYESPYIADKDKIELAIYKETQFYNELFTEYDLEILGGYLKLFSKAKGNRFSFKLGYAKADSLVSHSPIILTGDIDGGTLRVADRSYEEYNFSFSYFFDILNNPSGFSSSYKKRKYLSEIDFYENEAHYIDKLHIDRKHKDITLSFWIKFQTNKINNKINLSYRKRTTKSPYGWVENLKSFDKINIEYSIYFKKIKFSN